MDADVLTLTLPSSALAAIAEMAAELVLERVAPNYSGWPEWLSVETAARYLDCSEERVRKLVARRAVPFYQEAPGCRVFFNRDEVDQAMRALRVA